MALTIERIDALEARMTARNTVVYEALEIIAEIGARIYYKTKPLDTLPTEVINAGVMDAMIERWPEGAKIEIATGDHVLLRNISQFERMELEAPIVCAKAFNLKCSILLWIAD